MKHLPTPTLIDRIVEWIGSIPSLLVHTALFLGAFLLGIAHLASWEIILLVLTTIVSLEAIYLAIFIQMTVNRNTTSLREVEQDINEIHEDVEELGEDIDEIQEDMEDIQEDLEEISEDEERDQARKQKQTVAIDQLTADIRRVLTDLEALKEKQ